MANKSPFKTTFEASEVIRPIFTGGSVALENGGRILATTLGEDAILTDLKTGKHITKVDGVCIFLSYTAPPGIPVDRLAMYR
jgi:U3 small nucleolar RNA-associated protein 13